MERVLEFCRLETVVFNDFGVDDAVHRGTVDGSCLYTRSKGTVNRDIDC